MTNYFEPILLSIRATDFYLTHYRPQTRDPFPSRNNTHFHLISYFLFFFVWVYNISSSDLCQTVGMFQGTKNTRKLLRQS